MNTSRQRRKGLANNAEEGNPNSNATPAGGSFNSPLSTHPPVPISPSNPLVVTSSQTTRRRRGKRARLSFCPSIVVAIGLCLLGSLVLAVYVIVPKWQNRTAIRLPVAGVDIDVPNASEWPLIHIVNTRFMQEQSPLTTLGMARLHLFWTFCFPTMIGQSTQQFLWIIKTDPQFATLDNDVFVQLLETVRPHPNIYVVASNRNFLISPELIGCWRDGAEGLDLLRSQIYAGNITKLHQAIALRELRPVLETRLDADDGLHTMYLQYLQYVALKRFTTATTTTTTMSSRSMQAQQPQESTDTSSHDNDDRDDKYDDQKKSQKKSKSILPTATKKETSAAVTPTTTNTQWLYWCTRRHLEWRSNEMDQDVGKSGGLVGLLNPIAHSKLCITPGITVGYNVGVDPAQVPSESHDLLYKHLVDSTACMTGDDKNHANRKHHGSKPACLDLVDDLIFSAIRSRTWTSAGMQNVNAPDLPAAAADLRNPKIQQANQELWKFLEERFHMNRNDAKLTQDFLQTNKAKIAYENLLGQCTSFHSCKQQAKDALQKYIEEAMEQDQGDKKDRGGGLRAP